MSSRNGRSNAGSRMLRLSEILGKPAPRRWSAGPLIGWDAKGPRVRSSIWVRSSRRRSRRVFLFC